MSASTISLNGAGDQKLRIALLACWGLGCSILRVLANDRRVEIVTVLSRSHDPYDPWSGVVQDVAKQMKIPERSFENMSHDDILQVLAETKADLLLVHAYPQKLPPKVFQYPQMGTVNIHPSLLPLYRGKDPTQRVLADQNRETGLTAHYMNNDFDTGDIICQKSISLFGNDNKETVITRLKTIVPELIHETITHVLNPEFSATPQ